MSENGEASAVKKTSPLFYAMCMFGTSVPINMFRTFGLAFYVDYLGMSGELFALVTFVYTFLDAIDNIIYGYLSDRTRTKWGRRKPWLVVAHRFLQFALFSSTARNCWV